MAHPEIIRVDDQEPRVCRIADARIRIRRSARPNVHERRALAKQRDGAHPRVQKRSADGIAGDWSKWRSDGQGGSLQPYAQIYNDPSTGFHLKVWPASGDPDHVSAFATCLYLKN